jgi:hypothetical protein
MMKRRTITNSRRPKRQEVTKFSTINAYIDQALREKLGSMQMQKRARAAAPKARSVVPMPRNGSTNIPLQQAFTLTQTASKAVRHKEVGSEVVATYTMIPQPGQLGQIVEVLLNPEELPGTRLNQVARNYQKFRFNRASLCVASNLPTAVTGQITAGFTNQPTQKFTIGPNAPQEVYSLPGAKMAQVWTPFEIRASLDKKEPLFIDNTGSDLNTTVQGKFILTTSQVISTASPVTFNLLLDYDVDFYENAILAPVGAAARIWPSAAFTTRSTSGLMGVTIAAGETTPFPGDTAGVLYQLNPSPEAHLISGGEITGKAFLSYYSPGPGYPGQSVYLFYEDEEAFNNGTPFLNLGCLPDTGSPNQDLPRSVSQRPQGN